MPARRISIFDVGDYEQEIRAAAGILNDGGLVVLPTETVYGAGATLTESQSVRRLRGLPPQTEGKPLVVHLARPEDAKQFIGEANDLARRMMRKLWPGPVSLVFDVAPERQRQVADELGIRPEEIFERDTITLRCPDHVVANDVLSHASGPVVLRKAPDASGATRADSAAAWSGDVDLILDAGPTRYSKPSTMVKVNADGYQIIRQGVYDQRIIERLLRTTILFVCSGNTCRSPMAEAIARQILARKLSISEEDLQKKGVNVISAGSFAMPGSPATPAAVEAMRSEGADLSKHRSRPLTVELIHQADLIYTMGRSHAQAVVSLVPSAADKVMSLSPDGDIEDPIGGDLSLYRGLAAKLKTLIEKRLEDQPVP